ncbi:DUF2946 domain-containing protein [Azospirillum brasilense]|uniref:DUF2946 domain-containing protein n=1 Tax=Azospirillum brasilense TaxID=192 RepID=A0A4D8R8F8_AZOBR|nr:DUF2946 family protein [Azospirillum brasilense]NUB27654.1 DUF2946 domain-containing protein [Azospirillum brasilense]NUB34672.1 DUF2946 domain-containing protein [Azospirillum brasilense]QCO13542.1 DUF2946 domain-containing protein [Azospirillum brasilense]QEL94592.1 DUF2946 domain-containing protein [Azospirillum brasilense]QEM01097.1 DUF2946 domain-containing protein [Azospirillum brasilense]
METGLNGATSARPSAPPLRFAERNGASGHREEGGAALAVRPRPSRRPPSRWRSRIAATLAAILLLILVQVPGQAVAMLSAGLAQSFWASSMCGPDGASDRMPAAPGQPKHDLEHCLGCQLGCAPPAMLSPADVAVPPPRLSGAQRALPFRTRKLRRRSVFRPNARAPPMMCPAHFN